MGLVPSMGFRSPLGALGRVLHGYAQEVPQGTAVWQHQRSPPTWVYAAVLCGRPRSAHSSLQGLGVPSLCCWHCAHTSVWTFVFSPSERSQCSALAGPAGWGCSRCFSPHVGAHACLCDPQDPGGECGHSFCL